MSARTIITVAVACALLIGIGVFIIVGNPASQKAVGDIEDNRFLLDTVVSIRLYESDSADLLNGAFEHIGAYESILSRHQAGSEVAGINAEPAGTPVTVSRDTVDVLLKAIDYAELSNGAFDPTVGPLVDLWGIGGPSPRIPIQEEIDSALSLVDYRDVIVDEDQLTITLGREGMLLDLGGIAKGWIADRICDELRENGENHILINLGGNVLVSGGKPDGSPFRIGMQDPSSDRGRYLGIFTLENGSVVSSGVYERYFESDGVRYHHILSTNDGRPVRNGLAAVTILSENSVDGDGLSTTVFALGLDAGMELVQSLENVEAAFVTDTGRVILTEGAAERFNASDPDLDVEIRPAG